MKILIITIYFYTGEIEQGRSHRNSITFDGIHDANDSPLRHSNAYSTKMYTARRAGIAGYGYHRRRLRINQESRGSKNRSSMCVKSGKHNLVSSSVHRNLLIIILVSFIPLLLIQGTIYINPFYQFLTNISNISRFY